MFLTLAHCSTHLTLASDQLCPLISLCALTYLLGFTWMNSMTCLVITFSYKQLKKKKKGCHHNCLKCFLCFPFLLSSHLQIHQNSIFCLANSGEVYFLSFRWNNNTTGLGRKINSQYRSIFLPFKNCVGTRQKFNKTSLLPTAYG